MYYIISNIYIFIMYMNVLWGYLQVSTETREVRSQQGVQGREAVFIAVEQSCLGGGIAQYWERGKQSTFTMLQKWQGSLWGQ